MTRITLTDRAQPNTVPYSPAAARAHGAQVFTGEGIDYFRLASMKGMVKLEKCGLKHSGGAVRPRIAAELGMKPRDSHDKFLARIEELMAKMRDE